MTIFGGFIRVCYYVGMIVAVLLVLAIVGIANQHDKLSMAAVGDGLVDVLKWGGELIGKALSRL